MFIPFIGVAIVVLMGCVFNVDFERVGFLVSVCGFLCIFGGTFVFGLMLDEAFEKIGKKVSERVLMSFGLAISLVILGIGMQFMPKKDVVSKTIDSSIATNNQYKQTSTIAISKQKTTASYYKENYPMTWGYIKKYARDPESYVEYYDSVWGDLQAYHGDGIIFNTLTWKERQYVHYPSVGSNIYFSSQSATEYHSTMKCYSLLRTKTIYMGPSSDKRYYDPCSKCVKQ